MATIIDDIKHLAYELYKIDWMRRISPERQMDCIKNYYDDKKKDPSDDSSIEEIIEEFGYDGELYACYEEFLDAEYQDRNYIRSLLNDDQYDEYLADLEDEE